MDDGDFQLIDSMLDVEYYIKITFIVLILLLNGTVVVCFLKMKKPLNRSTPNIFLLNQALGDTTICIPMMMHVLPRHVQRETWQHHYSLLWFTVFVSIGAVMLNTVDRYFTLKNPFHSWRLSSIRKVGTSILLVWVVSAIPAIICAVIISVTHNKGWSVYWKTMIKLSISLFAIVLLLVIAIVILIILSANALNQAIQGIGQEAPLTVVERESEDEVDHTKERRMVKIMYAMVFVYSITTFPWIVAELLFLLYEDTSFVTYFVLLGVTYMLYTISAIINPLLTLCLKHDYNQVLKTLFRRRSSTTLQNSNDFEDVSITMTDF